MAVVSPYPPDSTVTNCSAPSVRTKVEANPDGHDVVAGVGFAAVIGVVACVPVVSGAGGFVEVLTGVVVVVDGAAVTGEVLRAAKVVGGSTVRGAAATDVGVEPFEC